MRGVDDDDDDESRRRVIGRERGLERGAVCLYWPGAVNQLGVRVSQLAVAPFSGGGARHRSASSQRDPPFLRDVATPARPPPRCGAV